MGQSPYSRIIKLKTNQTYNSLQGSSRNKKKQGKNAFFLNYNQLWIHEQKSSERLSFTLIEVKVISLLKAVFLTEGQGLFL